MPSPFPGMDPYLEDPDLWPDVHHGMIAELHRLLGPILRPRYFVAVKERHYLAELPSLVFIGRPDLSVHEPRSRRYRENDARSRSTSEFPLAVEVPVPDEVRERHLEVRTPAGDVVAVIELLSPTTKVAGRGRTLYLKKRSRVLGTLTHLVEIDLIRAGEPMPIHGTEMRSDYRILVSRGDRRPMAQLWLFSVRDPIPKFELPLRAGDKEPEIDLSALLRRLYEVAGYDLRAGYLGDPVPPLAREDADWAARLPGRPFGPPPPRHLSDARPSR